MNEILLGNIYCYLQFDPAGNEWTLQLQKTFFDRLGVQLGHKSMDDWYDITLDDISKNGHQGFLRRHYKNSPSLALRNIYPEHHWELEKSKNKPKSLKNSNDAQRKLFLSD